MVNIHEILNRCSAFIVFGMLGVVFMCGCQAAQSYQLSGEKPTGSEPVIRVELTSLAIDSKQSSQSKDISVLLESYAGNNYHHGKKKLTWSSPVSVAFPRGGVGSIVLMGDGFTTRKIEVHETDWGGNTLVIKFDPELAMRLDADLATSSLSQGNLMGDVAGSIGQAVAVPIVLVMYIFDVGGLRTWANSS
jgi:hypothetical protein